MAAKRRACWTVGAVLVWAAVVSCSGGVNGPTPEGDARVPEPSAFRKTAGVDLPNGYEGLFDSPYTDEVVARVDGYPVTREELARFRARLKASGGFRLMHEPGDTSLVEAVESFSRHWLVVRLGAERGLHRSDRIRALTEIYELAMYANDYKRALPAEMVLTPEEVEAFVPPAWVRMEFEVKAFDSLDAAAAVRERIETGTPWDEVKSGRALSATAERGGTTGLIFPGGGFFDPADDAYLFTLPEGAISRPVVSGVGPALVRVVRREDMDTAAVDAYLAEQRAKRSRAKADQIIARVVEGARPRIDEEALARCVRAEVKRGVRPAEVVAWLDGERLALDYPGYRILVPVNYPAYLPTYPEESWGRILAQDIVNLERLYRLGRHARDVAGRRLGPRWEKELYDFRHRLVYDATLRQLFEEAEITVSAEEVQAYLKQHPDVAEVPGRIRVRYVYAPKREILEGLVAEAGDQPEAVFALPRVASLVKEVILGPQSAVWGELYVQVKDVPEGGVAGILSAETGYYLVDVLEKVEPQPVPAERAAAVARRQLEAERRQEAVRRVLEAALTKADIELLASE